MFNEKESIEILKILNLIKIYNYFKNMEKENASLGFKLSKIDETGNYF